MVSKTINFKYMVILTIMKFLSLLVAILALTPVTNIDAKLNNKQKLLRKEMKEMVSQIPKDWEKIPIGKCDYIIHNVMGAQTKIFKADSFPECIEGCTHNTVCDGAIYNPKNDECVHSTQLLRSTNRKKNKYWKSTNKLAIYRKDAPLLYFQEYCINGGSKSSCNSHKVCTWNKGDRGINQHDFYTKNYCGRRTGKKRC